MAALALSMLFMWAQPAYAVENAPQTMITENPSDQVNGSNEGEKAEPETGAESEDQEKAEPETGAESDDQEKAEPGTDSGDESEPEQEKPEPLPVPGKIRNLYTTCQSKQCVLLQWQADKHAKYYKIYRKSETGKYQLLNETAEPEYTDRTVEWEKKYHYKIVAVNAENKRGTPAEIAYEPKQIVCLTSQKYSYAQMKKDLHGLKALYGDYCELTELGTTVQGRKIYDLAIGAPDAKKSLLVVCTLHAREYIASVTAMQQIEHYLQNYNRSLNGKSCNKLFSDLQIHYIVMANPDGVTISQTKNPRWKSNGRGVDLNRNFPAKKFIVGGSRGSEGYSGPHALSEPESQAVANLTKRLKKQQSLAGVVNYHAMGQIIFGDCSQKALASDTKKMYDISKKYTGYSSAGGYSSGSGKPSPGGSYREYVMQQLHIPSITIELGSTIAPCAFWEYRSVFEKNKYVVFDIAYALK